MKIVILGAATTSFGELWDKSPRSLVKEVVNEALISANLALLDIDALYVGNMLSGILGGQENLGALYAEELGLTCPAFKIEGACASGGLAFYNAVLGIKSGVFQTVLVVGVEKMTDHPQEIIATSLMAAASSEERLSGITFPGLYALMARSYMEKYKLTEEEMGFVAVKNHYHASLNGKAQFRFNITVDQVLKSPKIADPLKLLDCSPISDGASAVIVSSKIAKSKNVFLNGTGVGTDSLGLMQRQTLTAMQATQKAAKIAYNQASVKPADIDVAEVHDCFTIAEIMAMEDLGFCDQGESKKLLLQNATTLGKGKLTINTSGGLKACGHPVGATGIKQIVEITHQLQGEAGKKQVANARIGLTHNVGGTGAVAVVNIFEKG